MSRNFTLAHGGILLCGHLGILKGKGSLARAELLIPLEGWARVEEPGTRSSRDGSEGTG